MVSSSFFFLSVAYGMALALDKLALIPPVFLHPLFSFRSVFRFFVQFFCHIFHFFLGVFLEYCLFGCHRVLGFWFLVDCVGRLIPVDLGNNYLKQVSLGYLRRRLRVIGCIERLDIARLFLFGIECMYIHTYIHAVYRIASLQVQFWVI